MINYYINQYETRKYITKEYINSKIIKYGVTQKKIIAFLKHSIQMGFREILLYEAGEGAKIILQVINSDNQILIETIAIIDDEPSKQERSIINTLIIGRDEIASFQYDGILISSYTNNIQIFNNLFPIEYQHEKIANFFDK